ncbi:hypothetical protein Gorai_018612, partial [Gossypium raimondii]|nr:hypothetical protein [Gossypium raimondii]
MKILLRIYRGKKGNDRSFLLPVTI